MSQDWIAAEIEYFSRAARERYTELRHGRYVPFRITIRVGAPVALTAPWIMLDGLLGHLLLINRLGPDFYITPKKINITPFLPPETRALIPLRKTGDIYHASASVFVPPAQYRVTKYYKRFEALYADGLRKKRIDVGRGHFRGFMMRQVYVPCREVVFYGCGDLSIIRYLMDTYLVSIGDNGRVGWGAVREITYEEIEEDLSLVANGTAMRPIPVEMCSQYEEAVYLPYRSPYWDPTNVRLCVPPGARCKLKE